MFIYTKKGVITALLDSEVSPNTHQYNKEAHAYTSCI